MRGHLRKESMANGTKFSLYIDYYPPVWNPMKKKYTRREYLGFHIFKDPKTELEKKLNALHTEVAEKIYLKRMKSLMLDANGVYDVDILEGDFYTFYNDFITKKSKDDIDTSLYTTALRHLKKWRPENLKFKHIDELFLEGFKSYLKGTFFLKSKKHRLSANSKASYYDKVAYVVQDAFIQRYLPEDYTARVKRLPNADSKKERLEPHDVRLLINNPCENDLVFRSSMFALLSGFRWSAIEVLKYEHFHFSIDLDCWYVYLVDPKPGRPFKHFISKEAMYFVGELNDPGELVFGGITYHQMRAILIPWFDTVGLKNKAKFHNWRRRYASDLSDNEVDIYIIKDMLNHKFVSTTEIYTDVSDKNKAKAAKTNRLQLPL